jgi:hypothetical protein
MLKASGKAPIAINQRFRVPYLIRDQIVQLKITVFSELYYNETYIDLDVKDDSNEEYSILLLYIIDSFSKKYNAQTIKDFIYNFEFIESLSFWA